MKFAPLLAVAGLTAALVLPAAPAAAKKRPTLTGGRAQTQLEAYIRRAYSVRVRGRDVQAECTRITRTFQDCTYRASITNEEAGQCGILDPFRDGSGPAWCTPDYGEFPGWWRYSGTGSVRLIGSRLLIRASYPR